MGTRNNPGRFDCLAKLAPDEPFFVLRGQDILSAELVLEWAARAKALGCPPEKIVEAAGLAADMVVWPNRKAPD